MLSWAQGQATTAIGQWKSGDHEAAQTTLDSALKQLKPEADKLTKKLKDLAGVRPTALAGSWRFVHRLMTSSG
ncbi:hypothetical protein ACQ4WX_34315 [Streptomyces lasalocidi]